MFVLPTFGLGVIGSPTVPYIFNDSLTFPTIQVFNTQEEITSTTLPPPNFTIVHAKDTDRLLVWNGSAWAIFNQN